MIKELISKIKKITDILWAGGVTNPITYIEQISYLIYLKRYDEKLKQDSLKNKLLKRESVIDEQTEKFRWHKWVVRSGENLRNFIRDDVFPYMEGLLKENPQAAEYFGGAQLQITDPNTLKQVVDILDSISFTEYGPDVTGDLFEYMLTHLGTSALNGQFRTPKQIRSLMVELVDPDLDDTIFDPACGTGGFLLDSFDYINYKYSENPKETPIYGEDWVDKTKPSKELLSKVQVYKSGYGDKISTSGLNRLLEDGFTGYDVNVSMVRIATMNMILHGLDNVAVKTANTLSDYGGIDQRELMKKYSIILTNPPFAGQIQKDSIRKDITIQSRKTEVLFMCVIMDMLAPGGRAAIVVPEGLLFGSGSANETIRKRLVDEFHLRSVISLPSGVFKPYAGVKTSIVVFEKPLDINSVSDNDFIWFYNIKNDGYDPDKITQEARVETPDKSDIPELLDLWNVYKNSNFKEPPGEEGSKVLEPESNMPTSWYVTKEVIAESNYNLSANTYTPQIQEKISDEKPEALIEEIIDIEKEILGDLTNLLDDFKL